MKPLYWVDSRIIDGVYQRAANRLHLCVQDICRLCLVGMALSTAYSACVQIQNHRTIDVVVRIVGLVFCAVIYSRLSSQEQKGLNPFRATPLYLGLRFYLLSMVLLELVLLCQETSLLHLSDVMGSLVYASFWYFLACTEAPPKERWNRVQSFAGV